MPIFKTKRLLLLTTVVVIYTIIYIVSLFKNIWERRRIWAPWPTVDRPHTVFTTRTLAENHTVLGLADWRDQCTLLYISLQRVAFPAYHKCYSVLLNHGLSPPLVHCTTGERLVPRTNQWTQIHGILHPTSQLVLYLLFSLFSLLSLNSPQGEVELTGCEGVIYEGIKTALAQTCKPIGYSHVTTSGSTRVQCSTGGLCKAQKSFLLMHHRVQGLGVREVSISTSGMFPNDENRK